MKELDVYDMMVDLLYAEKKCLDKIRQSEEEVCDFYLRNRVGD